MYFVLIFPFLFLYFLCVENMVRGLDDEESEFLEKVSQKQIEIEESNKKEEKELMNELKISFCNFPKTFFGFAQAVIMGTFSKVSYSLK